MRRSLFLALPLGLAACATAQKAAAPAETPAAQEAASASHQEVLPFIQDDYGRALALARAQGLPLFVDAWAPWCHTCRSMNANVFPDARLAPHAGRFVWLSIDTEKEANAAFLERFPMDAWPTLFIIEPQEERAVLRWLGSATVEQLEALLDDGVRAVKGGTEGAEALLARADRLYAEGQAQAAASALEEVLARAPADWPRRARAVESLLMAKGMRGVDPEGCARVALAELPRLPRSASWANVAALGLFCALEAEAKEGWREQVVAPLEARVREALAPPAISMAVDDKSGLYDALTSARQAAGDMAGMRAVAEEWLAYLEAEAERAPNPDARAVYDSHRMSAALLLGQPERVVAALEASEAALPQDYNPPSRLAVVYLKMGRLDDALAASDRALPKAYGPRKVKVLNDRGDILLARRDKAGAREAFAQAKALAEGLSPRQQPRRELKRSTERLAGLE